MKTIKTEIHNKPITATHYRDECNEYEFSWVKFNNNSMFVWDDTYWDEVEDDNFEFSVKPIKTAALENQMNIDNLATQTPEEKEALDSVRSSLSGFADIENNCVMFHSDISTTSFYDLAKSFVNSWDESMAQEALDLIDTTPHQYEMSKFSGNEWNGEGLPPVGSLCKVNRDSFVYRVMYSSEYVVIVQNLDNDNTTAHGMDIILDLHKGNYTFSKPESPQQREERECLEAAYDLYTHWNDVLGRDDVSHISNFKEDDNYALFRFFIARSRNLI